MTTVLLDTDASNFYHSLDEDRKKRFLGKEVKKIITEDLDLATHPTLMLGDQDITIPIIDGIVNLAIPIDMTEEFFRKVCTLLISNVEHYPKDIEIHVISFLKKNLLFYDMHPDETYNAQNDNWFTGFLNWIHPFSYGKKVTEKHGYKHLTFDVSHTIEEIIKDKEGKDDKVKYHKTKINTVLLMNNYDTKVKSQGKVIPWNSIYWNLLYMYTYASEKLRNDRSIYKARESYFIDRNNKVRFLFANFDINGNKINMYAQQYIPTLKTHHQIDFGQGIAPLIEYDEVASLSSGYFTIINMYKSFIYPLQ